MREDKGAEHLEFSNYSQISVNSLCLFQGFDMVNLKSVK